MDPRTLAFYGGTISGVLALLTVGYWKTQRTYPGFGWWVLSLAAFAAAPGSIALRGVVPDAVAEYGPTAFGMVSMLAIFAGQNGFFRATGTTGAAAVACGAGLAAMTAFDVLALPDARRAVGAAAVGLLALVVARRFAVLAPKELRTASWFCAAITGLFGLTRWWRALYFVNAGPEYDVLASSIASAISYSMNAVFATLWTLGFVVLNASRLECELEESRAELQELSRIDPLTGLRNRRAFFEEAEAVLRQAARYAHPTTLLALDVDRFKQVNDQFGHPAGDDLLKAVADVLRREVRSTDLTTRLGGEEFALLLTETSSEGARETAERIRLAIEQVTIASGNRHLGATASIGIASSIHEPLATVEALMHRADAALYEAKQSGRNCVVTAAPVPPGR